MLGHLPRHACTCIYIYVLIVTGVGIALLYITTSEILTKHFDRYKYLAFSLVMLGQFSGLIAWPIVSQELLERYGYSKAMIVMSSFHIIHILAGFLFIEPVLEKDNRNDHSKYCLKLTSFYCF